MITFITIVFAYIMIGAMVAIIEGAYFNGKSFMYEVALWPINIVCAIIDRFTNGKDNE